MTHKQELTRYVEKNSPMRHLESRTRLRDIRNQFFSTGKKYGDSADYQWLDINDQLVAELILSAIADSDKRKILDATLDKSRTPVEILDVCKIPSTSGYRKIKSLIQDGLLIPNGVFLAKSKRHVRRYISALENIKIDIDKGKLAAKVRFAKI